MDIFHTMVGIMILFAAAILYSYISYQHKEGKARGKCSGGCASCAMKCAIGKSEDEKDKEDQK